MRQEPQGEERDDLRIGALASVIWNCNLDTSKIGGMIEPHSYLSGWNNDRVGIMAFQSQQEKERVKEESTGLGLNLNDPVDWENFTTGLIKAVGGKLASTRKDN
jgi:hypothetical protein